MHCFGLHVQHEQYKKSSAAVLEYVPLNNNKSFASWNMESVRLVASTDDSYDAICAHKCQETLLDTCIQVPPCEVCLTAKVRTERYDGHAAAEAVVRKRLRWHC